MEGIKKDSVGDSTKGRWSAMGHFQNIFFGPNFQKWPKFGPFSKNESEFA